MTLFASVRALLRRSAVEREMQAEMARHLDLAAARYRAGGLSSADSMAAARREFGNLPAIQESARDARGMRWLHDFTQDLRFGTRQLAKAPLVALATIAVLGVGVAGAGLASSVVRAYLLNPLPVP